MCCITFTALRALNHPCIHRYHLVMVCDLFNMLLNVVITGQSSPMLCNLREGWCWQSFSCTFQSIQVYIFLLFWWHAIILPWEDWTSKNFFLSMVSAQISTLHIFPGCGWEGLGQGQVAGSCWFRSLYWNVSCYCQMHRRVTPPRTFSTWCWISQFPVLFVDRCLIVL